MKGLRKTFFQKVFLTHPYTSLANSALYIKFDTTAGDGVGVCIDDKFTGIFADLNGDGDGTLTHSAFG